MGNTPEGTTRTTFSDENEPGSSTWNPRDYASIRRLIDNPLQGRETPQGDGSHAHDADASITLVSYTDENGDLVVTSSRLPGGYSGRYNSHYISWYNWKDQFEEYGLDTFLKNVVTFEEQLIRGVISDELHAYFILLLDENNGAVLNNIKKVYPRIELLLNAYDEVAKHQVEALGGVEKILGTLQDEYMKAFGDYKSAIGFENTGELINKWFKSRDDVHPDPVNPWELRIGASRFFVPPINIDVNEQFKVGSLAGGALRSQNSPKFNSGHSETVIEMTLYFPNHESIWGYYGEKKANINFDTAEEKEIDRFISSLRGLITQFKYAPFLPVRNDYLNRVYDISAVALHSMSIQTIEGFPFCVAVNLQMLKFNWKPFLQPITDFNQAIHWGRYRQYIGRAAQKLNSVISEGFLIEEQTKQPMSQTQSPTGEVPIKDDKGPAEQMVDVTVIKYEGKPEITFDKIGDWNDGRNFRIYYPKQTPGKVFTPDSSIFRQDGENLDKSRQKNFWELFLQYMNIDVDTNPESRYEEVNNTDVSKSYGNEREKFIEFMKGFTATAEFMTQDKLDDYIEERLKEYTGNDPEGFKVYIKNFWFNTMFESWHQTPFFQDYILNSNLQDGNFLIKEWQVPMDEVKFNWKNIVIEGLSVSLANNIIRLQLQMEKDPVHQHIGGRDSTVNVSMLVFGEEELIKFRRVFDHISGLARLEHAHGVLGFLGIKNVITALAGIKYVLPMNFEVKTVPGFPHVYRVALSFVDFDIFQQKREQLSSAQQQQLVDAFGKRNPFFRIKQLWGAFNAYPDFPLAVRDDSGNVVGHLDPDFYFRAFNMYDNDIFDWGIEVDAVDNGDVPISESESFRQGGRAAQEDLKQIAEAPINSNEKRLKQISDMLRGENGYPTPSAQERKNLLAERKILEDSPASDSEGTGLHQTFSGLKYYNQNTLESRTRHNHQVTWGIGMGDENQSKEMMVRLKNDDIQVGEYEAGAGFKFEEEKKVKLSDTLAESTLTAASVNGLSAYVKYQAAHADGNAQPAKHWELMMTDAAYRDISGRMIRAFPTYMLWLIDEGGRFAGVKLFDNFYGLQSVIDFSLSRSEDVLGDTLVLRLSNLYQKLTTPYADYLFKDQGAEEDSKSPFSFIDTLRDRNRNINSGTNDRYMVELENIRLKPGVRLHLRMGYSSNPNSLHTVFNGTITEVRAGDIVEVVAQSDAIELSPYLNTTNKNGHSGDGELGGGINTGFWMSEPRDLMVRLLSMGSSSFRESLSHATKGTIFSDNKFGIRHFGQIMYAPLSDEEAKKQENRVAAITSAMDSVFKAGPIPTGEAAGAAINMTGVAGIGNFDAYLGKSSTRTSVVSTMQALWNNFTRKRDYEIFKRNIYPGNGMGVAQFLGGDSLDGGVTLALAYKAGDKVINQRTPNSAGSKWNTAVANATLAQEVDNAQEIAQSAREGDQQDEAITEIETLDPTAAFKGVLNNKENSPIMKALGLVGDINDDDKKGFDEITFRAQTYMKSVWDIFQLCAALLPNYIVAVRPFEDRSTIFYGKPHWLYTSGLIPITTGIQPGKGPKFEEIEAELEKFRNEALNRANAFADFEAQMKLFSQPGAVNPYTTAGGLPWAGGNIQDLPLEHPSGAKLVIKKGKVGAEMHLPTNINAATDRAQHIQLSDLPDNRKHPVYMDKEGGGAGGVSGYNPAQEGAGLPGAKGAFGYLPPEIEQWYMNMPWPYAKQINGFPNPFYQEGHQYHMYNPHNGVKKVLIYAEKTGKACVCAIGEFGPHPRLSKYDPTTNTAAGVVAGASPDVMHVLGISHGDECQFGFVDDATPLGPTSGVGIDIGEVTSDQTSTSPEGSARKLDKPEDALTLEELMAFGIDDVEEETEGYDPTADDFSVDDMEREQHQDELLKAAVFTEEEFEEAWNRRYAYGGDKGHSLSRDLLPSALDEASETNPIIFAWEFGAFDINIPVWIAPSEKEGLLPGKVDLVGITARRLYDKDYNEQFSGTAGADALQHQGAIDVSAYDVGSNFLDSDGAKPSGGRTIHQAITIWHEFREESGFHQFDEGDNSTKSILDDWVDGKLENTDGTVNPGPTVNGGTFGDKERKATIARFMRFMWQEPYARAWLVMTTNRTYDGTDILGPVEIDADDFGLGGNNDLWDFQSSPVMELFKLYLTDCNQAFFDQRNSTGDFTQNAINERLKLYEFMRENNKQGKDSDDVIGRAIEDLGNALDQSLGRVWQAISAGLSGLTALYRIAMMQMGQGLDNVNTMQKQANILNKVFNDSIYYAAGQEGSVLRLADNPFTREYGEPVIEIREPFQKMHYLSSFQHIISNNIVESLSNVPTVVTATSDGSYPVTVYFDRGAPPERQTEKVVETGLFWDNARGSGFFGFLHPLLHPIETARGVIKNATGTPDELSSKRVALYHLKEGLKDIYTGELVVLGNPSIEPHDLVYLADVYERMYGMFEVEQVIHHFTPETGFITSIVPNAIVTVNDPTRWSMISWVWSWFGVKNMRDDVRSMLSVKGKSHSPLARAEGSTLTELASALEPQMMGHLQYAHGNSALIRDLAAAGAVGNMGMPKGSSGVSVTSIAKDAALNLPGLNIIRDVMEPAWDWVKDNLVDQQGCYIQYLNKNGQSMDAGLSFAQGVAVGRHHSITVLPGILGLQVDTEVNGNKRITADDLLGALGWNEVEVNSLQRDISFWVSQTNAQILKAAGKSPDVLPFSTPTVEIVTVSGEYFDGDTFHSVDGRKWRLAGVAASEISHAVAGPGPDPTKVGDPDYVAPQYLPVDRTYAENHIAYQAAAYLRKRLYEDPIARGHQPTVAVRIGVNAETYDRQAVVAFHNVPEHIPAVERDDYLLKIANQQPLVEWDAYDIDGKPYTINWEVIAAGLAQTALYNNNFDAERGAIGIGYQGGRG